VERRLLILDDDPMIGRTMQAIAEAAGVATRFTVEPAEFFRWLEEWQPSHIALDLVMPEMDGVQVLARLAEVSCRARIIISSGVGGRVLDAAGRSAAEHGLDIAGVLPKPFTADALRRMLAGHGASAHGTRAVPAGDGRSDSEHPLGVEELARAIESGELFCVYQPKVHCVDARLAGFEALVRWRHPERGVVPPDRFIRLAEDSGLIGPLTDIVLDTAMGWIGRHYGAAAESGEAPVTLSINISARTVGEANFVDRVLERCARLGVEPGRLIFELTETSAMDDPVASLDLLTRLRMKGFQLSIDDFGTGYSSMVQLARLPFSEIKVDKSFVMHCETSAESRAVIKSIVDLGHNLGLRATAEGVESERGLAFLREIGCDLAQGYFIARPMEGAEALAWVQGRAGA
jgi:EAL domain-containing protein (putative c-di-GMP-specific phosphodiesterase class I)/ActR/RegA family two-component response regulator